MYKVKLITTGTGSVTGSEYLVWSSNSLWKIRAVSTTYTVSNYPVLVLEGNVVKVKTNHTGFYNVKAFVKVIETNESDIDPSIFGSSYQWQRKLNDLSYPDGKVGIGTTTPLFDLHIEDASNPTLAIGKLNTESGGTAELHFYAGKTQSGSFFGNGFRVKYFKDGFTDRLGFVDSGDKELLTIKSAGNVGIGTTTPSEKLEVNNGTHTTMKLGTTDTSGAYDLKLKASHSWNNKFSIQAGNAVVMQEKLITGFSNPKLLLTHYNGIGIVSGQTDTSNNNQVSLYISGAGDTNGIGNVGVGTTTVPSGYKFAVAGKVISEEVKVQLQSAWPDYVFTKNYSLPSLEEVEKHITSSGHLKDIPSAAEVEKNGIFLGEMDAKLLQKIEELTLYTIQQQKEINQLKNENAQLKEITKKLKELEKLILKSKK